MMFMFPSVDKLSEEQNDPQPVDNFRKSVKALWKKMSTGVWILWKGKDSLIH